MTTKTITRPPGRAPGPSSGRPRRLVLPTPVGPLTLIGDDDALTHVLLPTTKPGRATAAAGVASAAAEAVGSGRAPRPLADAARQLDEYFAGRRRTFELALAPAGTTFQRRVWFALADIAYATTISYATLAARVGRPAAFRAVGQANGANPLPIVLPCHRVVATGGGLGGYGGGLDLKRALLALEADSVLG